MSQPAPYTQSIKLFKFRYLPSISDHAIHRVRAHEMIEIPRSSPTKWIIKTRDIWLLLEFQPQILLNQIIGEPDKNWWRGLTRGRPIMRSESFGNEEEDFWEKASEKIHLKSSFIS